MGRKNISNERASKIKELLLSAEQGLTRSQIKEKLGISNLQRRQFANYLNLLRRSLSGYILVKDPRPEDDTKMDAEDGFVYRLQVVPSQEVYKALEEKPAGLHLLQNLLKSFSGIPAAQRLLHEINQLQPEVRPALHIDFRVGDIVASQYDKLSEALAGHRMLRFQYCSVHTQNQALAKTIVCYPLQLRFYDRRYYLLAWPIKEEPILPPAFNDFEVFAIDRIDDLELLEPSVLCQKLTQNIDVNAYFAHCFGVYRPKITAKNNIEPGLSMYFKGWAVSYILACPLHPGQKLQKIKNTHSDVQLFTFPVYDTFEAAFTFGRFRQYCWPAHLGPNAADATIFDQMKFDMLRYHEESAMADFT